MQDIRQETCYDDETDRIFIPFKDSNLLFNDLFQDCVIKVIYRNISENRSYTENQINEQENFWGPSRIDVSVVYQDKNTDEPGRAQIEHVELSPEQVKSCPEPEQLSLTSTTLIIIITLAGLIFIIIISLIVFSIRRKKAKKPQTGVDTNPEYGADYYYKQNQEMYEEGDVQYVT